MIQTNSHMKEANRLALVLAFYLSKYDKQALISLGYTSFKAAYAGIEEALGVKANTVKNMRDTFDPIFDNARIGWVKRPLSPSPARVVEMFDEFSFETLTSLCVDLLHNAKYRQSTEVQQVLVNPQYEGGANVAHTFVPRGITGRKAEELFIERFHAGLTPFQGELIDRREHGCGYDFGIRSIEGSPPAEHAIEVKGLAGMSGGIAFTDKEWQVAQSHPSYKLFVVYNLDGEPQFAIIDNPCLALHPSRQLHTVVQVTWQVPGSQLPLP